MEKLVYLLWGRPDPALGDALRERLLGSIADVVLRGGAHGLTVNVHDAAAAEAPSPAPGPADEPTHVAQVSVWVDSYDRRGDLDDIVSSAGHAASAYLVTESLYDDYGTTPHAGPRTWPDGERSPGVLTIARIHRPEVGEVDRGLIQQPLPQRVTALGQLSGGTVVPQQVDELLHPGP